MLAGASRNLEAHWKLDAAMALHWILPAAGCRAGSATIRRASLVLGAVKFDGETDYADFGRPPSPPWQHDNQRGQLQLVPG